MAGRTLEGDRGESLLELIIAVAIMSVAVIAVAAGIGTAVLVSDIHRKQATAGTTARDYGEAIQHLIAGGGYVACASTASYASPPGFLSPPGYSASVVPGSLRYWTGSGWQASCTADKGLQRLTVRVRSGDDRAVEDLVIVVRKRCGLTESPC
ncbi:prepilin-type N-terminal cleavage/methylation domain-containing protein [Amycolatopsis japonica]|uniref:type IV pilus modification PilV family protein n=1 Tax=Amycolatopsis japonica TaxID=208439 RepID=UPI0037B0973E